MPDEKKRHFILEGTSRTEALRSPTGGGRRSAVPARDRASHGAILRRQIEALRAEETAAPQDQPLGEADEGLGLQIEFASFPDIELAFESLARERSGIELLTGSGRARLRRCEGPGCVLYFVAANPRRRWCSPRLCGNRVRVARHYRRYRPV